MAGNAVLGTLVANSVQKGYLNVFSKKGKGDLWSCPPYPRGLSAGSAGVPGYS